MCPLCHPVYHNENAEYTTSLFENMRSQSVLFQKETKGFRPILKKIGSKTGVLSPHTNGAVKGMSVYTVCTCKCTETESVDALFVLRGVGLHVLAYT